MLLLLDVDLLAEAASRPTARKPVLPEGLIQRLLRGSMQGRGSQRNSNDECTVPYAGDVYFITDGGRDHLQKDIVNSFVSGTKKTLPDAIVKNVWMVLSEQSIRSRKMIVRGEGINQKMQAYVITKHPISDMIPEKEFKGYNCTNRGHVIGTINLSPLDTAWSTTFDTKKKSMVTGSSGARTHATRTPATNGGTTRLNPPSTTSCHSPSTSAACKP